MLQKNELKELYNKGFSIREIAEKKNLPHSTVRYWFKKHGIKKRPKKEACYYGYWKKNKGESAVLSYRVNKILITERIKKLYYEKRMSVPEIANRLRVSTRSIYKQMDRSGLRRRTNAETKKLVFKKKTPSFKIKKKLSLKERELMIAGIMLYWAEGSKIKKQEGVVCGKTVDFTNSDPTMIRLFLSFLRKICRVDERRLRIYLYCYANQDVVHLKNYWSKLTKIPLSQFTKPYVRKEFSLQKIGKMKYGLVHIRYSDKKLLLQIYKWIEEYLEKNKI